MSNTPATQKGTSELIQQSAWMPSPAAQIDLIKLALRYRYLLLLGLMLGLIGGFYHNIQTPELYQASAKLQIVEPVANNLPLQALESSKTSRSLADEAMVMRGEEILRRAATIGQLNQTPGFAGQSVKSIASSLAKSSVLRVEPAHKSAQTNIFQISYQASDPLTAQSVVQAIVDAYAEFLQDRYRNVGKETLELIHAARKEVLQRLEAVEEEYEQFTRTSPLVIRDGRAASVHRDNADKFLSRKQSLIVRKAQLDSTLHTAQDAIRDGTSLAAVLMALSGARLGNEALDESSTSAEQLVNAKLRQLSEEIRMPPSQQIRETRLLPMEIQLEELLEQLGAGHPAVRTLQGQISLVQGTIERMQRSEQEFTDRKQLIIQEGTPSAEEPPGTATLLSQQVDLTMQSLAQQLLAVQQELDVISEAYEVENEAAKAESTAEAYVQRLEREITRQQALYNRIVARLDEIDLLSESGSLRVFPLDSAQPGDRIAPKMSKSLLMGSMLGLMLAGALAYAREMCDKSYRSAEQVAEHLRMPIIGHVPAVKAELEAAAASGLDPHMVTHHRPSGSSSEAFKAIRTAIYFSNRCGDFKVIQVTSPIPGDGKSTIAANLAVSIAQSGKRVLLLDTDLRRPKVQQLFGITQDRGLAWLLEQMPTLSTAAQVSELAGQVIRETGIDNLQVMGSGARPENPSELLSSQHFDTLLAALRDRFDVIIIDSPPLLAVTDPSTVACRVDAVVLVVRIRKNIKPLAARAARMLETLEANVLGVVVNGIGSRDAQGYGQFAAAEGYYNRGPFYQYAYGYSYGTGSDGFYNVYHEEDRGCPKPKHRSASAEPVSES